MLNVAQLERDLEAKRREGLALLDKTCKAAEAENRVMTVEEEDAVKALSAEGLAIKARLDDAKKPDDLRAALSALTLAKPDSPPIVPIRQSLGAQWAGNTDIQDFFKKGLHRSSSAWRSPSIELAVDWSRPGFWGTTLTEGAGSGGSLVLPQYLPGIMQTLMRRLMVADLMASGTTNSNAITYMVETAFTNAAAPVLEGTAKPESALAFSSVTEAVRKIAHWLPVTEEMLEDVAAIASYIDARLRVGVQFVEEDQLVNGSGIAPNLLGILNRPGLATAVARAAAESNADAIFRQIMAIYGSAFLMPDGVVINPKDWADTVLTKTAQGNYLTAGPFAPIQSAQMWGLPVAVTPVVAIATAVVGAFQTAAQVFRRGGIRVESSNSHQDFFIKNLVAIRAEERLALAVYRPGAFGKVTGLGLPVYP